MSGRDCTGKNCKGYWSDESQLNCLHCGERGALSDAFFRNVTTQELEQQLQKRLNPPLLEPGIV